MDNETVLIVRSEQTNIDRLTLSNILNSFDKSMYSCVDVFGNAWEDIGNNGCSRNSRMQSHLRNKVEKCNYSKHYRQVYTKLLLDTIKAIKKIMFENWGYLSSSDSWNYEVKQNNLTHDEIVENLNQLHEALKCCEYVANEITHLIENSEKLLAEAVIE